MQDDVYDSWTHPSIIYFITKFIANVLNFKEAHLEISTLLRMRNMQEIESWMRMGCTTQDE